MPYFPNMPYQTDHTHHTYPTYHTTPPPHHGGEGGPVPHPHHTTGRGTVQCHTPTTPQGGNGKISYGGSIWDPMSWGGGRAWCKYIHHIPIHHIPTYDVHVRIVRPPPERPATRRTARSGLATWMAQTWPLTSSPSMPPVSAKPNFKKSSEPWSTEPKLSTEDGGDWGRAFGWGGPAAACFFKTRTWNVNTMMLPGFFLGCEPIWREVSLRFISEVVNGLNHSSSSDGWPAHKHQGSEILWMAIGAARVLITAAFNNYCWQKRRGAALWLYEKFLMNNNE